MLARIDLRGNFDDLRAVLARPEVDAADLSAAVAEIIDDVRTRGAAAVRELTARLDGVDVVDPRVGADEISAALERISPGLRAALELARDQIVAWHEAQREREPRHERLGVEVLEMVVPVDRAGCYVPGGRAPLASSVLMTVLTARVAGVPEVVLCSPPGRDGRVDDAILAAAAIAQADEVYAIGGAQAVAAMAFGAGALRPVDVIVGPGNAYVVEAKRQVFGTVGIDGLAGASEVAIVADGTVDPAWIAADLLAQAEHGPGGAVALIVWDDEVAERVDLALETLLVVAPRRDEAISTLEAGGRVIFVDDAARAMDAANAIAPEHLELMCAGADLLVSLVRNAGAVFVGAHAPAVIGDYVAGTNHVLPTGGTARFASALRVADFQKHIHVVHADAAALARVGPAARSIAEAEGLFAHADAVRLREEAES
ncbi:MAG TPA: histidinol dehydrogenase [Acidimicrobiia bacterium]|jgi:histidinol dehydrogenase|nr:histidinol dehydrogenase [Acidimicrobiia bacterium]